MSKPIFQERVIPTLVLMCECNNYECAKQLPLDKEDYMKLWNAHPNAAVVLSGHQLQSDVIILDHGDYVLVRD